MLQLFVDGRSFHEFMSCNYHNNTMCHWASGGEIGLCVCLVMWQRQEESFPKFDAAVFRLLDIQQRSLPRTCPPTEDCDI